MKVGSRLLHSTLHVLQHGSKPCYDLWLGESGTDKRQEVGLKMLRFSLGMTRMD